ncbi:hypothetical protein V2J09_015059 [Rumex salicifolius]
MPSLSASTPTLPFSKPLPASSAMEPPVSTPPPSGVSTTTTAPLSYPLYPGSVDSSPRSRTNEAWEGGAGDALPPVPGGGKLRLMCSYGGHIVPRPHDKSLCYVGGETRIVVVDRNSTLPDILQRLSKILLNGRQFTLKYQLPNEDLDSLITVTSEEDLENMIDEYDRLTAGPNPAKSSRIRLFLFSAKLDVAASMGPILDGSNKSDDWFLNVLNGADLLQRGFSDPASVNCLLGLEEHGRSSRNLDLNSNEGEGQVVQEEAAMGDGKGKVGNLSNQDVHSMLDSSVIETNSSFGSASSSPAMSNLPRIRVHVEEGVGGGGARLFDQRVGIEDQFAHMGVNVQKQEEGFGMMSSPPSTYPVAGVPVGGAGEYTNRVLSDDDRSDRGAPAGYLNQQPPQLVMVPNSQAQTKQINEDLPSPVSVSSSLSNATARQKPGIYQDPSGQITSGSNRVPSMAFTDSSAQAQQVSESGYAMPSHYDQLQQQSIQSHHHQQQQAQQFIHASNQFVQHHPGGGMPLMYYPVYPSQQPNHQHQIDQRYQPVYYVPAGQTHGYNLPVQQQPSYTEAANMAPSSQPQASNPTYNTSRNMPPSKAEIPQASVYRTGNPANPQLVQVPSHQHQTQQHQQFMGYSQIQHPSQSMTPNSAASYGYELSDPAHTQVYFTQPLAPQMAAQYQTVNSGPAMVASDASAAIPNESVKPQARTS